MKLISRKAITATIAAAAISTASLTAPAMADTPPADTTPAVKEEKKGALSSSEDLFGTKDGEEKSLVDKIKDIVAIFSGIGALFGAIVTINNNIDRILKGFKA